MIKQKVLILGGSGLLGCHLIDTLKNNYEIFWTFSDRNLVKKNGIYFKYPEQIFNLYKIILEIKPKIIINTVALVSVDKCQDDETLANTINIKLVEQLINFLNKNLNLNIYFIHFSSGGIYGNAKSTCQKPWKEIDEPKPLSTYASTKLASENETLKYKGQKLIIRSDFYGINKIKNTKTLLSWIIFNAKNNINMDGWSNIYFSPISASALSAVVLKAIKINLNGIYNVGSIDSCNKYEFIKHTCSILNYKTKINKVLDLNMLNSKIRPNYSVLCTNKLRKKISFDFKWKKGLEDYISDKF